MVSLTTRDLARVRRNRTRNRALTAPLSGRRPKHSPGAPVSNSRLKNNVVAISLLYDFKINC